MTASPAQRFKIHTGRELKLMLVKKKPLAHFYDEHPVQPREEIIPERSFAPYVVRGVFEKFEYVELLRKPPRVSHAHVRGIRHVFYALPSEAWRIEAYIDMQSRGASEGWSLGLERLQGHLLGYEDWQTQLHIDTWRENADVSRFPWLFEAEGKCAGDA